MNKLGAFLAREAFEDLKAKLSPRETNGAVFLGLDGVVIKGAWRRGRRRLFRRHRARLQHGPPWPA